MGLYQSRILRPGAGDNWGSRDLRRAACLLPAMARRTCSGVLLTLVTLLAWAQSKNDAIIIF